MARKTVEERRGCCDVGNKEERVRGVGTLVEVICVDGVMLVGKFVGFSLVGVCVVGIEVVGELVEAA